MLVQGARAIWDVGCVGLDAGRGFLVRERPVGVKRLWWEVEGGIEGGVLQSLVKGKEKVVSEVGVRM